MDEFFVLSGEECVCEIGVGSGMLLGRARGGSWEMCVGFYGGGLLRQKIGLTRLDAGRRDRG